MKLNAQEYKNTEQWTKAGFTTPKFDREKVIANTRERPVWVHFGAGNIFRAYPATRWQQLLDEGLEDTGIIVAEGFDYEIVDAVFKPHDNLSVTVTLKANGTIEKTLVGSMVEALKVDSGHADFVRLKEIFRAPSLKMVSFTITEKGYSLLQGDKLSPVVESDFKKGPTAPESYIGKLAALVYERYLAGKLPLALVSMDNCSHNGTRLYDSVRAFAFEWAKAELADKEFLNYVESPEHLSFPWSMIDKITPRPDDSVKQMLLDSGFEDVEATITSRHTYVAPFVNAEETEYLVIEDHFPNGRPAMDRTGVIFTARETVDKMEKMKVCTCLNPLHLTMAVFGCPLGFTKISDEMKDPDILRLVEIIGYDEGLPVVVDPGIVKPRDFLDECIKVRFPNPFMPDTPQRIAVDCSQKFSIRFGETIKTYMAREDLDVQSLVLIPLTIAAWCRYMLAVDDNGKPFEISPDPRYDELSAYLKGIGIGSPGPFHDALCPILSDAHLFGVDLYEVGLGERIEGYFAEMVDGVGAIRRTLHKYVEAHDKA